MKLRDIFKMNSSNDGTRSLLESVAVPEVGQALKDWIKNSKSAGVLIGGLALSFYIKPRTTMDVDYLFLSKDDIPTNVPGFKRTRPGAFQHNRTHVEIEVVDYTSINIPISIAEIVTATAANHGETKVASPSGIVALKLFRANMRDKADIWELAQTCAIDLTPFHLSQDKIDLYNQIVSE